MEKDYHKAGYWKDWYWNKGGRDKVQKHRLSEEGKLRRKMLRLKKQGLEII